MKLIFTGLILAYNPVYLNYLMSHGALGGMSIRAQISGLFLCFAILYKVVVLLTRKSLVVKPSAVLTLMTSFFVVFIVGVITGLFKDNEFIFWGLDAFPLFEMFCLYYLIRLTPEINIDFDKIVKWLSIYMLVMCISDIATYIYLSFIQGIGFGALRANINGIPVNRLMDFMVPILGPGLIVFSRESKNRFIRMALPACVLLTVGLTFYRTAYLAFFAGFLILIIQKRKNLMILSKTVGLAIIVGFFAIFVVQQKLGDSFKLKIGELVTGRMIAIFNSPKDDGAIYSRVTDTYQKLFEVPNLPIIGHGMGGSLESGPIQYTANYFLQLFLLLGIPGGILFIWLYARVVRGLFRLSRTAVEQKEKLFYLAGASSLTALAAVLCFFPYTMYFPLLYLFGVMAGIADVCSLHNKNSLSMKARDL